MICQAGSVTLAVALHAIFGMPATDCQHLFYNSVPAHPFLDLCFKWDQRSASGRCQRRLVCYPHLPRGCSSQWFRPSSGFPGSTQCPYCSPQQGRDCAGVSHHREYFAGFVCAGCCPESAHSLVQQVFPGHLLYARCSARHSIAFRQVRSLSSCSSPRHGLPQAA